MKRFTRILIYTLLLLAAAAGIAWRLGENKEVIQANAEAAQVRNLAVPVTVVQAEMRTLRDELSQTGTLKAFRSATLVAETAGRLTQLPIENGSSVRAGQTVAAVDNELLQQQLTLAKLNLEKAERDAGRLANLAAEGGVAQQQLDDARNGIDNLKAQIRTLETQIARTYVKAPFAGTIVNKSVERGSFVSPPQPLAELVQTDPLLMQVYVTEGEVVQLKNGQAAQVAMDLQTDRPLPARVRFIDVQADPSQRYLVELEMRNPGQLRAGMNGRVTFSAAAPSPVLTLPRAAFIGSLRAPQVYVVVDGKASLREVKIGQVGDAHVEILSGITPTDTIVLTGQINLTDGAAVVVQ